MKLNRLPRDEMPASMLIAYMAVALADNDYPHVCLAARASQQLLARYGGRGATVIVVHVR
jgi:hypothetical protein